MLDGCDGNDTFVGGAGADRFRFDILGLGNDRFKGYEDALDHLSFATSVADDFSDFTITGNATTTVTIFHGARQHRSGGTSRHQPCCG